MNIQIFGKPKSFDTKKAERYFKERGIKYQYVDLLRYGMSSGEYKSIKAAVGGLDELIDQKSRAYEDCFIAHLASEEAVEEKLYENPSLFKAPIVRNRNKATVGFKPEIWKEWD